MSTAEAAVARALGRIEERFIAASGPGGQNVNKLASAVQLRLDVYALRLAPAVFARLRALAGARLTSGGELVLTARRFRTQEANRADARARLAALVRAAHDFPAPRVKSRLNRVSAPARIDAKKRRAALKAGRGPVGAE